MRAIQDAAELAVRNLFKRLAQGTTRRTLKAVDYMDDGTPIALEVQINGRDGSARFDFTGTGPQVIGMLLLLLAPIFTSLLLTSLEATGTRPSPFVLQQLSMLCDACSTRICRLTTVVLDRWKWSYLNVAC